MRTGVPCNENRFFPVRISTQGKTCSGPVLALYGIAVGVPFFLGPYLLHAQLYASISMTAGKRLRLGNNMVNN